MASQGKGARDKGSGYERTVAKKFSEWWGGSFSRTPGSGSLHWGSDQRIAGDIVPPQGMDFPFVIECKKHEGWTLENVFLNTGEPKSWWQQVVTDARRVKMVPMLIFSRNRAKDFIMLPYSKPLYNYLQTLTTNCLSDGYVTFKNIRDEEQTFRVLVTTLDVLSQINPEGLRHLVKGFNWDPYAEDYE
jgi:Holliday junction resolvase